MIPQATSVQTIIAPLGKSKTAESTSPAPDVAGGTGRVRPDERRVPSAPVVASAGTMRLANTR